MDRRLILGLVIAAIVAGVGIAAFGGMFRGAAAASASPGIPAAGAPTVMPSGSASAAASSGPAASCFATSQRTAVRATEQGTGFPVAVEWIGLGPAGESFFTQSEVAPRIPIDPLAPASITLALQYTSASGDRYKLTGGSLNLAYDPATGRVTGSLDTGYGKNSNVATTDTVPSRFDGVYTAPSGASASGRLEAVITHPDREDYRFAVQMAEAFFVLANDPACASPRATDAL